MTCFGERKDCCPLRGNSPFFLRYGRGGDDMEPYEPVCAQCAECGGEIYRGESCYHINAQTICPDCLADYAARWFAPYLVKEGRE